MDGSHSLQAIHDLIARVFDLVQKDGWNWYIHDERLDEATLLLSAPSVPPLKLGLQIVVAALDHVHYCRQRVPRLLGNNSDIPFCVFCIDRVLS